MYTIALSGPERTRAQAEVALELARIPILPDDHHAPMPWASKFPEDDDAWLTVEHEDVDVAARVVESAGWRLRVHYPAPEKPKPTQEQIMAATIADMQAEIAALKAAVGKVG